MATLPATRSEDGADSILEATSGWLIITTGSGSTRTAWSEVAVSDIVESGPEWSDYSSDTYRLAVRCGAHGYVADGIGVEGRGARDAFRAAALSEGAERG